MGLSRREFFKIGTGSAAALLLGFDAVPVQAQAKELKIARTTETKSICPYCSVSCGVIIHTLGDKAKNVTAQVVHVEGDPDDPINRGTLCPKGASLMNEIMNDRRSRSRRYAGPAAMTGKTSPGTRQSTKSPPRSRRPAMTPSSRKTTRAARSTVVKASPSTAAALTPTNSTGWW
jgi:hypothetical protein